MRRKLWI